MNNRNTNSIPLLNYPVGSKPSKNGIAMIQRSDFPAGFVFGCATSAYQVEGAWAADGKGASNWDVFTQRTPKKIDGGATGCVAINHYHRLKEDVALIKKVGFDAYRFSISWSRILPRGRISTGINREGIKYYNDLIDLLILEGITPYATIFHWEVPQCLEDEYTGFLKPQIVKDFCEFAELCFWEFGDRVKYWITLNEPWSYTVQGYVNANFPPARGATSTTSLSKFIHPYRVRAGAGVGDVFAPTAGNPGTEPYTVAHHLILAHAATVDIYRRKFQAHQRGKIGITNVSGWYEPYDPNSQADVDAASRALDFMLGWFVAPLVTGDYPETMRTNVGDRLPTFTPEEASLVKGSYDFLGINYYTANYAQDYTPPTPTKPSYTTDQQVQYFPYDYEGHYIGPQAGSSWLYVYPRGIYKLVNYVKETYNNPPIYITENGVDEVNDTSKPASEARIDDKRITYHTEHLINLNNAIDDGADVKGYFIWSMFDNFEWAEGYSVRFGITYVDYVNGHLTRYPKSSAIWFMNFLSNTPNKPLAISLTSKRQQAQENEEEYGSVKRLRSGRV